jgi:hypothetical protein
MSNRIRIMVALAAAGCVALPTAANAATGADESNVPPVSIQEQTRVYGPQPGSTVKAPLTAEEVTTLQLIREEEKLAHDVYADLFPYCRNKVFKAIAKQEAAHFKTIGKMLKLFGVPDPAVGSPGVFSTPELQAAYADYLARGMVSCVEAYKVGVDIEMQDIADLGNAMDETDRAPLEQHYRHLLIGAENHLRMFQLRLQAEGETYP